MLVSTSVPPTSKLKKFGAVAWGIGVLLFAMIFVGAIAGPKFIRFQTRSMQSEAKANLRELFVAERAFRDQHGAYAASAAAMGWVLDPKNRYTYFFGDSPRAAFAQTHCPVTPGRDASGREVGLGVTAEGFLLAAARTDESGEVDCWSIASMDRTGPDGAPIPLGVPFHETGP